MQFEKITLFVDGFSIFIRIAGFEIYGTIADRAYGRMQIVVKRHENLPNRPGR
jgi:hypothetical protein